MGIKMDKGPQEVMRALLSCDPEQFAEAADFQRESFRARLGCYPEKMVEVFDPYPDCSDPLHAKRATREGEPCPTCGTTLRDWRPRST